MNIFQAKHYLRVCFLDNHSVTVSTIKNIVKEYYKLLHANKLYSLDATDKFPGKLTQEEEDNIN